MKPGPNQRRPMITRPGRSPAHPEGGIHASICVSSVRRRRCHCGTVAGFRGGRQGPLHLGLAPADDGPASATQAPVIEMLRIYIDRLNAKGGINGHKINLLVEDDQAEPSKAAANATKLVRQENVILLI